ncbi:hypothetical protein HDU97_008317, partial [Phlyctochytrium planicorne]
DSDLRYRQAFTSLGCKITSNKLLLFLKLLRCSSYVSQMLTYDDREKKIRALKALSNIFSATISKSVVSDYIATTYKGKIVPAESTSSFSGLFETIEDIKDLAICAISFFTHGEGTGLEMAFGQCIYYLTVVAEKPSTVDGVLQSNLLATAKIPMGVVLLVLGKISQAKYLFDEAFSLQYNLQDVEISRIGLSVLWSWGCLFWSSGDFPNCLLPYEMFVDHVTKGFDAGPTGSHFLRMLALISHTILGDTEYIAREVTRSLKGIYSEFPSLGKWREAFKVYDELDGYLDVRSQKEENLNTYKVLPFVISKCHLEIARISEFNCFGLTEDALIKNLLASCEMLLKFLKKFTTRQPLMFPFLVFFIPTWLDFVLVTTMCTEAKVGSLVHRRFRDSCQILCKVCKAGSIAFPYCFAFVKKVEAVMGLLFQKEISRKALWMLVKVTKCFDENTPKELVFLGDIMRARILARVLRMATDLKETDKMELLQNAAASRERCVAKLLSNGMEMEAKLMGLR